MGGPGGPGVKTSPFNAEGTSLISGWRAKISPASGPKNQNIKKKKKKFVTHSPQEAGVHHVMWGHVEKHQGWGKGKAWVGAFTVSFAQARWGRQA